MNAKRLNHWGQGKLAVECMPWMCEYKSMEKLNSRMSRLITMAFTERFRGRPIILKGAE